MISPCVRCGHNTDCVIERCQRCRMVAVATCRACDVETAGKVREYQRQAHAERCARLPRATPWQEGADER